MPSCALLSRAWRPCCTRAQGRPCQCDVHAQAWDDAGLRSRAPSFTTAPTPCSRKMPAASDRASPFLLSRSRCAGSALAPHTSDLQPAARQLLAGISSERCSTFSQYSAQTAQAGTSGGGQVLTAMVLWDGMKPRCHCCHGMPTLSSAATGPLQGDARPLESRRGLRPSGRRGSRCKRCPRI